jgi:DNA-binding transcriptional MerR regulator
VGKSPDAFRTIGEVSKDLVIPQHILRFWEAKFPQLRPVKRSGNRRYYRREDVDLVRRIDHLLNKQGYTIAGVQRLLRQRGGDGEATESTATVQHEPAKTPAADKRFDRAALLAIRDMLADALTHSQTN